MSIALWPGTFTLYIEGWEYSTARDKLLSRKSSDSKFLKRDSPRVRDVDRPISIFRVDEDVDVLTGANGRRGEVVENLVAAKMTPD